jgi:hypothetical protein
MARAWRYVGGKIDNVIVARIQGTTLQAFLLIKEISKSLSEWMG